MSQLLISRVISCRSGAQKLVTFTSKRKSTSLSSEATKFFERHAKRGSPLSPYIMYQPQLTWLMSITHRITGLGLGVLLYGFGVAELACPNKNFAEILKSLQNVVPESLLCAVKVLGGSALAFHTFNGVRHLAWDAGYGFRLNDLYKSGYVVLGLTIIAMAFILANKE